jgi:hypothetical protein
MPEYVKIDRGKMRGDGEEERPLALRLKVSAEEGRREECLRAFTVTSCVKVEAIFQSYRNKYGGARGGVHHS